ncbi:hypothetical protein DFJ73DRAFT_873455 [Zopfochytrium polystomum]|nr:hypothetical protein DFJ73DRAFT_873455 [Zopfochytrium polystomum]
MQLVSILRQSKWIAAGLVAATLAAQSASAACSNPTVRREWNQLSSDEKTAYVAAIKTVISKGLADSTTPGIMGFYDFVKDHVNGAYYAHGVAQFYPFHRAMVYLMEQALLYAGWSGGLVYWDWSAVSQNWWEADVFNYVGEVDGRSSDNCVTQGAFGVNSYSVSPYPSFGAKTRPFSGGSSTCLRRCGYVGSALDDPSSIASAHLMATNYNDFRASDSTGYHANGHITVGGDSDSCDMGNFYCSPNDPLFYLHHGFIDKSWWKWQQLCSSYKTDFSGYMVVSPADASGLASTSETLDQWTKYKVSDMLDTLSGSPLCYTYTKSGGDVTFNAPTCPDGSAPNFNWAFGSASGGSSSGGSSGGSSSGGSSTGTTSAGSGGSGTTATSTSASPLPTIARDLEAEKTWLSDKIKSLYAPDSNGGFSRSGGALARRDDVSVANTTYVPPSNTTDDGPKVSNQWMSDVKLVQANASSTGQDEVQYGHLNATVVVPAGCSIHLVASDRVVAECDAAAVNSTSDKPSSASFESDDLASSTVFKTLFPGVEDPTVATIEIRQFNATCVKPEDECLKPPRMISAKDAASRHIVYDSYIKWYNGAVANAEACNMDPTCESVAIKNLKKFKETGSWDFLNSE